MNAVYLTNGGANVINRAFNASAREQLNKELVFVPEVLTEKELPGRESELSKVEYIFSTWGMPALTEEQIGHFFPSLKAVFYGAGSVQPFARPFLAKGVHVFSAASANAVPVAEYTAAQIVLANKGFYKATGLFKEKSHREAREYVAYFPGNYAGTKVGIIGAGMIGKLVIGMLKTLSMDICVFDPFLPQEKADELGVEKCSLEKLFEECFIISNHLANNEKTKGMLNYSLFSKMQPYATFINTGRGAQVVEADLVRALTEDPTRLALLDVTFPEPPEPGHAFYSLPNVLLTPHIAGSHNNEIARMGKLMLDEYLAFVKGSPLKCEVTVEMLETMA